MEVVEVEAVQKETAYVWGHWTIMESFTTLKLRNKEVVISLVNGSPMFWFLMNGEEIDHHGEIVATAKTPCKECELIICNDILENISRPHKPVFPTPNKDFILTWNNWEVSSKKYEELLITNGKECQIMIKKSSTNIHFTVQGVQRTYFDLDE